MKRFISLIVGLISLLAAAGAVFGGSTARYLDGVKARAATLQTGGGTTKTSGKKGHKIVKRSHKGHKGGKKSKKGSGTSTTPPPK